MVSIHDSSKKEVMGQNQTHGLVHFPSVFLQLSPSGEGGERLHFVVLLGTICPKKCWLWSGSKR